MNAKFWKFQCQVHQLWRDEMPDFGKISLKFDPRVLDNNRSSSKQSVS